MATIEQELRNLPAVAETTLPASSTPITNLAPTTAPAPGPATAAAPGPARPGGAAAGPVGDMDDADGELTYAVGQTGTLWDPTEMVVVATISVSALTFATTDASGDTPEYGYFATFTVTVTDIAPASSADTISPSDSDYYVGVGGTDYGYGQTDLGSTPDAEGPDYLGYDVGAGGLNPGQSTTGTVTVDVPSQHGSLVYSPLGTALGAWTF